MLTTTNLFFLSGIALPNIILFSMMFTTVGIGIGKLMIKFLTSKHLH